MMHYLAIVVALGLSSIAAYFSVLGLSAIFAASAAPVMIMAAVLEIAKVITAVWLHLHWKQLTYFIKIYLCLAVMMLMAITSMGIFGFLSKAHIDHQVKVDTTVGRELKLTDVRIEEKKDRISELTANIEKLDSPLDKLVGLSKRSKEARQAMWYIKKNKKERDSLVEEKRSIQKELSGLKETRVTLESEKTILQARVGPIKYIADRIYGKADADQLEASVFWLIIALVICFDPLAIALLLGTNIRFGGRPPPPDKTQYIAIPNASITKFK